MSKSRVLGLMLRVLVLGLTVYIIVNLLRKINFAEVWSAISTLTWVEVVVLALLLSILRTLNAAPISFFIPNLSLPRAVLNDLSGNLISTVSPPPSDMVVRYSMFKEWGIELTSGFAGVTLNTLLFYVIRFGAPILGVAILILGSELQNGMVLSSLISGLVAILILVSLVAVVRAKRFAIAVGRLCGRVAHRFRPDDVDADVWASKIVEFRVLAGDRLERNWPRASTALLAMVLTDGCILIYCSRAVSIPSSVIGGFLVIGAFLVAYPLTALPFAGIGILDAVLYELAVSRAGEAYSSNVVAALVIWRVTTLLVPLVVGGISYGLWRRGRGHVELAVLPEDLHA